MILFWIKSFHWCKTSLFCQINVFWQEKQKAAHLESLWAALLQSTSRTGYLSSPSFKATSCARGSVPVIIYCFFSEEGAKLIEEDFPSFSCALASHCFPPRLTSEAARGCETQSKSGSIMAGRRRCSRLEKPCPPRSTALLLSCDTKVEACYQVVT